MGTVNGFDTEESERKEHENLPGIAPPAPLVSDGREASAALRWQ
jgi:hypothetical protein